MVCTLPWRLFYVRRCVLLLRESRHNRGEFHSLAKKLANDYLCILLYLVLLLSGIKTRRALTLIYRNFKLNFYVGYLKYSHLKELKNEVVEGLHFYKCFLLVVLAVGHGPYRAT